MFHRIKCVKKEQRIKNCLWSVYISIGKICPLNEFSVSVEFDES